MNLNHAFGNIRSWSEETFGTRAVRGPIGPLKHLRKEAKEAIAEPGDIKEYADCIILIIDACWRAGFTPSQMEAAVNRKVTENKLRSYPKPTGDEISEHVK